MGLSFKDFLKHLCILAHPSAVCLHVDSEEKNKAMVPNENGKWNVAYTWRCGSFSWWQKKTTFKKKTKAPDDYYATFGKQHYQQSEPVYEITH